jgi:hypothetical protein
LTSQDGLEKILYPGSPFYPEPDSDLMAGIFTNIGLGSGATFSIASQIALYGINQNTIHEQNPHLIKELEISQIDLDNYFLGFVTAPSLIVGAHLMERLPYQKVIKILCPTTKDPILIEHHQYKANLLHKANRIYVSGRPEDPLNIAQPIYNMTKIIAFSDSIFFRAGVLASEHLFRSICLQLHIPTRSMDQSN